MRRLLILFAFSVWVLSSCKKDKDPVDSTPAPASFLSDETYTKLQIEVQSVPNYEPSTQTLNNLVAFLTSRLRKPEGIEIVRTSLSSPGKTSLSLDDIKSIEGSHRTLTTSGKTLTAYILCLDADYAANSGDSKVLGIAYGRTSMVLFQKTIHDYSGGLTQPSIVTLESTVAEHEFGHVLGLVNNGSRMLTNHQDFPHGAHCNNSKCLMYWSAETSDIIGNLLGNNIPTLDQNCLNDLHASGGL